MIQSARGKWMASIIADSFKIGEYDTRLAFLGQHKQLWEDFVLGANSKGENNGSSSGSNEFIVSNGETIKLHGKGLYFVRTTEPGNLKDVSLGTDDGDVIFGEISENFVTAFNNTFDNSINKPPDDNPKENIVDKSSTEQRQALSNVFDKFEIELKESFKSHHYTIKIERYDAKYKNAVKIFASNNSKFEVTQQMKENFTLLMNNWTSKIQEFLDVADNEKLDNSQDNEAQEELYYWKVRMRQLTGISQQLKSHDCRDVYNILTLSSSNCGSVAKKDSKLNHVISKWADMELRVTKSLKKAYQNVIYLQLYQMIIEPNEFDMSKSIKSDKGMVKDNFKIGYKQQPNKNLILIDEQKAQGTLSSLHKQNHPIEPTVQNRQNDPCNSNKKQNMRRTQTQPPRIPIIRLVSHKPNEQTPQQSQGTNDQRQNSALQDFEAVQAKRMPLNFSKSHRISKRRSKFSIFINFIALFAFTCYIEQFFSSFLAFVNASCPSYSWSADGLCWYQICSSSQYLQPSGYCTSCPNQRYADSSRSTCTSIVGGLAWNNGNACACTFDICTNSTQILKSNGRCETCGDYTYPNPQNTQCISDSCSSTQYVQLDGTCATCGDYTYPDSSQRNCISDSCSATQILKLDGRCEACGSYTHPDSTQKNCISDSCTSTQILKIDGTCGTCGTYQHPDTSNRNCISDSCTAAQILKQDGTCETCPANEVPNVDNTYNGQSIQCEPEECIISLVQSSAPLNIELNGLINLNNPTLMWNKASTLSKFFSYDCNYQGYESVLQETLVPSSTDDTGILSLDSNSNVMYDPSYLQTSPSIYLSSNTKAFQFTSSHNLNSNTATINLVFVALYLTNAPYVLGFQQSSNCSLIPWTAISADYSANDIVIFENVDSTPKVVTSTTADVNQTSNKICIDDTTISNQLPLGGTIQLYFLVKITKQNSVKFNYIHLRLTDQLSISFDLSGPNSLRKLYLLRSENADFIEIIPKAHFNNYITSIKIEDSIVASQQLEFNMLEKVYAEQPGATSGGDIFDQNSTVWIEYSRVVTGLYMQSNNDISLSTEYPQQRIFSILYSVPQISWYFSLTLQLSVCGYSSQIINVNFEVNQIADSPQSLYDYTTKNNGTINLYFELNKIYTINLSQFYQSDVPDCSINTFEIFADQNDSTFQNSALTTIYNQGTSIYIEANSIADPFSFFIKATANYDEHFYREVKVKMYQMTRLETTTSNSSFDTTNFVKKYYMLKSSTDHQIDLMSMVSMNSGINAFLDSVTVSAYVPDASYCTDKTPKCDTGQGGCQTDSECLNPDQKCLSSMTGLLYGNGSFIPQSYSGGSSKKCLDPTGKTSEFMPYKTSFYTEQVQPAYITNEVSLENNILIVKNDTQLHKIFQVYYGAQISSSQKLGRIWDPYIIEIVNCGYDNDPSYYVLEAQSQNFNHEIISHSCLYEEDCQCKSGFTLSLGREDWKGDLDFSLPHLNITVSSNITKCDALTFGGDPMQGYTKKCWCSNDLLKYKLDMPRPLPPEELSCNFTSINFYKNLARDALDSASGLGLISHYDALNKLEVIVQQEINQMEFVMEGVTTIGESILFPIQIKMYSVEFNQTFVQRVYTFKKGLIELPIFEFVTVSNGYQPKINSVEKCEQEFSICNSYQADDLANNPHLKNQVFQVDSNQPISKNFTIFLERDNTTDAEAVRQKWINNVLYKQAMNFSITSCGFEPLQDIEIPLYFTEEDKVSSEHIYRHNQYKIFAQVSPAVDRNCEVLDIKLVKDLDGNPLDIESGLGILTYDSSDDVIVIDKSLKGGKFSCFVMIHFKSNQTFYLPLTVYIFKVDYEPSQITRQFVYTDEEYDQIPIESLIANNITFWGETGYKIAPAVFHWDGKEFVEYDSIKVYVDNMIVFIQRDIIAQHVKFLKLIENKFGFVFYYSIHITSCAKTLPEDAPPIKILGEGFTSGITRGQSYFEDLRISTIFTTSYFFCKVKKIDMTLVKDETGEELDDKSGKGIVSYDIDRDYILVDRTIKDGKFEFFVQGIINENMTVHQPVRLTMEIYFNPAPLFEQLEDEPLEEMYLFVNTSDIAQREGKANTKSIESPRVIDNEGDLIYFEFSGFNKCPAITCEGFGAVEVEIIDHFRCNVNEKLITKACQGETNVAVNFLDESIDPKLTNIQTLKIEINYDYEGKNVGVSRPSFAGVVVQENNAQNQANKQQEEELPPPELKIAPMTPEGELSFKFNQDMAIPEGGMDYEALLSFNVKSSVDNSIKKAEFVEDPEEIQQIRRRRLQEKQIQQSVQDEKIRKRRLKETQLQQAYYQNKDPSKNKELLNNYAAFLNQQAAEDYDSVWGDKNEIAKSADALSSFWYVQSHTGQEIKFKFQFDNPDSVSSSSYGQDQIILQIKDLSQFESSSGVKIKPETLEGELSQKLPPIVSNLATAEQIGDSTDLMTKITNFIAGGNLVTTLMIGGSMQYLWGMVRIMQSVTNLSLIKVQFPAYTQVFFSGCILLANMDIFSGEEFFSNKFNFKETEPLNDRFEAMGMDSQNFILNSGSYLILLNLIYLQFYAKRIINSLCKKYPQHWFARSIGIYFHAKKEDPQEMVKASVKLFQETYFDNAMANILGILGFWNAYRQKEFQLHWDTSHNIFCSTITIIQAILHLTFPIWQRRVLLAIEREKVEGIVDSQHKANLYYDVLCEGILTYDKGTFLYNFYFIVQRLVLALLLILCREYPMVQFCVLIPLSMQRIAYMNKYQPFIKRQDNFIELFNEYTFLAALCIIHSMTIGIFSKIQKIVLGWALMGVAAINILVNLAVVIFFASQEIGSSIKNYIQKSKEQKDLEKRLYSDYYIIPGVRMETVLKMREEHIALQWVKSYMPHRFWMTRNNIELSTIPDEIHYQELEKKFQFTKKRQQVMTQFALMRASKQLMEYEEERIAMDQIKMLREQKEQRKQKRREELEETKKQQFAPDSCYGDEQQDSDDNIDELEQAKKEELAQAKSQTKGKFGRLFKRNNVKLSAYNKQIEQILEESKEYQTDRSSDEEVKQAKEERQQRVNQIKEQKMICLKQQRAEQKDEIRRIFQSNRFQKIGKNDKMFTADKFSSEVIDENFCKICPKEGKVVNYNKILSTDNKKQGKKKAPIMDLRFMSDTAKKEQQELENKIIHRMKMPQEQIDLEMIYEQVSSLVLNQGGRNGQISSVILVLAELKQFRKFAITSKQSADQKNFCAFFMRRIFQAILSKQITKLHKFTQISIKSFFQDWEENQGSVIYASEFWQDINNLLSQELSPKECIVPKFESQPWQDYNIDRIKLFHECFPDIVSYLFGSALRSKIYCKVHDSENEFQILNYTKINFYELEFDRTLGQAIENYFNKDKVKHYCKKCQKETDHDQEDLEIMISSSILTFVLPRIELIKRDDFFFNYPSEIDYMNKYSNQYQPVYELFAVIAFRGDIVYQKNTRQNYVTIIKRENGDVIEFDPSADGPKRLPDIKSMLNEQKTVEMLFYREKAQQTATEQEKDMSQSSQESSSSSGSHSESENKSDKEEEKHIEIELVPVKSKNKASKNKIKQI